MSYRHGDGHAVLGDSVHGRGHERRVQRDALCQRRLQLNIVRHKVNVAGKNEKVAGRGIRR
jgi:hypothetical protein